MGIAIANPIPWRGLLKTGIASTLHRTGAARLLARRTAAGRMPLIIGYHRVVEDYQAAVTRAIPPMLTSVATLERQLDWVGRHYQFVSLDQVQEWSGGGRRFERPVAAVTFDDGYVDVHRHAYPLLQRKGIPSAVFAVSDLIGTRRLQVNDELYLLVSGAYRQWPRPWEALPARLRALGLPPEAVARAAAPCPLQATWRLIETLPQAALRRVNAALGAEIEIPPEAVEEQRALNWDELRALVRGGVTVGSHTRSHVRLTLETRADVAEQMRRSRQTLEQVLGITVAHFAYPGGAFSPEVVQAAAEAGYRCGYTSCRHRDPRYPALTLPRRLWWEKSAANSFQRLSPAVMSCQVSGVFDFTAACGPSHA